MPPRNQEISMSATADKTQHIYLYKWPCKRNTCIHFIILMFKNNGFTEPSIEVCAAWRSLPEHQQHRGIMENFKSQKNEVITHKCMKIFEHVQGSISGDRKWNKRQVSTDNFNHHWTFRATWTGKITRKNKAKCRHFVLFINSTD